MNTEASVAQGGHTFPSLHQGLSPHLQLCFRSAFPELEGLYPTSPPHTGHPVFPGADYLWGCPLLVAAPFTGGQAGATLASSPWPTSPTAADRPARLS